MWIHKITQNKIEILKIMLFLQISIIRNVVEVEQLNNISTRSIATKVTSLNREQFQQKHHNFEHQIASKPELKHKIKSYIFFTFSYFAHFFKIIYHFYSGNVSNK